MAAEEQKDKKMPIVIITIGMAGAGKSTFVNRVTSYLDSQNKPAYVLNLDPAVAATAFEPNIDIRDTVNYHEVMRQWVSSLLCRYKITLKQVQPGAKRRHPHRTQPIHDQVRSGS